jgi:predicted O-linked N-acetylglucosamine transferase (SPINDLY family)
MTNEIVAQLPAAGPAATDFDALLSAALEAHQHGQRQRASDLYATLRDLRPDVHLPWYFGGILALEAGQPADAIRLIRRATEIDPAIADFHASLGTILLSQNNPTGALDSLGRALDLEPDHLEAAVNLGLAYLSLNRVDLAVAQLAKAAATHPTQVGPHFALGIAYRRRDALSSSAMSLRTAASLAPTRVDILCELAETLAAAKLFGEAERVAQAAVTQGPRSAEARTALGNVLRLRDRAAESVPHYRIAVEVAPNHVPALLNLGHALNQPATIGDAIALYRRVLDLDPRQSEAQIHLADALRRIGDPVEAERVLSEVMVREPGRLDAIRISAAIRESRGDEEGARKARRQALDTDYRKFAGVRLAELENAPSEGDRLARLNVHLAWAQSLAQHFMDAHTDYLDRQEMAESAKAMQTRAGILAAQIVTLGRIVDTLGRLDRVDEQTEHLKRADGLRDDLTECHRLAALSLFYVPDLKGAVAEYQRGLKIKPDDITLKSGLAGAYCTIGEMEQVYRLCREVLEVEPDRAGDWNNLGLALQNLRRDAEAVDAFRKAVELAPDYAVGWTHLGSAYQSMGNLTEARVCFEKAQSIRPGMPEALNNLGIVAQTLGDFAAGLEYLHKAIEAAPNNPAYHSNVLFGIQYLPDGTDEMLFEEVKRWGKKHAAPFYHKRKPHTNDADPDRKLRIGYVSPDFKGHSCSYFLYPIYTNHDREKYEIYSYAEVHGNDIWTQTFRNLSDQWRSTISVSDDDVAEMIRADKIDVLIDLGAHTGGSRVVVLAQKPAPVQASWLGLGNSTGVETIDYFITDKHLVPEGYERLFVEQVHRLPTCTYCYYPLNRMPDVGPLPQTINGHVTFGTLSRPVRLNQGVLGAWARMMNAIPGSRLIVNTLAMSDLGLQQRFRTFFADKGISDDRLELIATRVPNDTWGSYNRIDVALDPFPHNAGLTTYEALYMGCPVVTFADRPPQGRYGASILNNIGLGELVATSIDDYVRMAVDLARDVPRLTALKTSLRERMLASPLCDGKAYTRGLEDGYRTMWRRWCADQRGG